MLVYRLRSLADWQHYATRIGECFRRRQARQQELEESLRHCAGEPILRGYSYPAEQEVDFTITVGDGPCNWRETLACPVTGLVNRARGALQVFDMECSPHDDDRLYLMEQTTPIYRHLRQRFPSLVGSEYLGDGLPSGTVVEGIRHEDATQLSFPDESFEHVLHFDVFEHVPDYPGGFRECRRVLTPGGTMLWTVPFEPGKEDTTVRAVVRDDGSIEHLLEPEYHGDPVRPEGVLCFYHFGWDMLSLARNAGFTDTYAVVFWSEAFGYLGSESIVFVARR